jgi:hypothetical protein
MKDTRGIVMELDLQGDFNLRLSARVLSGGILGFYLSRRGITTYRLRRHIITLPHGIIKYGGALDTYPAHSYPERDFEGWRLT